MPKTAWQIAPKKQKPFEKKKKPNEDLELNVPIVTSVEELVGKKVQHLTFDYNDEENFFPGVVLCQKPNSDTELVIRYDCEDRLRQRFINDEENDIWWEQGIVIGKDLSNSSDFIVNFFDNQDYDESESSLNVLWSFSNTCLRWLFKPWCSVFVISLLISCSIFLH